MDHGLELDLDLGPDLELDNSSLSRSNGGVGWWVACLIIVSLQVLSFEN